MDKTGIVLLVLLGILAGAGLYFYFVPVHTDVLDNYQYSNGETVFDVQKVSETETYITLLVGLPVQKEYTIAMRNDPASLEDIPVHGTLNTRIFNDEQDYITINPEANLSAKATIAALEIDKIIDNSHLYGVPVASAMTQPYLDYPVKSCLDGTDTSTIIWLTLGSETTVYTDNNCIIVVGTDEDNLIRAADRFVYTLLGVMKA